MSWLCLRDLRICVRACACAQMEIWWNSLSIWNQTKQIAPLWKKICCWGERAQRKTFDSIKLSHHYKDHLVENWIFMTYIIQFSPSWFSVLMLCAALLIWNTHNALLNSNTFRWKIKGTNNAKISRATWANARIHCHCEIFTHFAGRRPNGCRPPHSLIINPFN